jgi:DNA-binding NtrC family response regulator
LQELQHYDWPGNVRELQNVIERAVILARGGELQLDLPRGANGNGPRRQPSMAPTPEGQEELSLDELAVREREIVTAALGRTHGKIYGADGAAALLRIKPTTLVSKMKRLNVRKECP